MKTMLLKFVCRGGWLGLTSVYRNGSEEIGVERIPRGFLWPSPFFSIVSSTSPISFPSGFSAASPTFKFISTTLHLISPSLYNTGKKAPTIDRYLIKPVSTCRVQSADRYPLLVAFCALLGDNPSHILRPLAFDMNWAVAPRLLPLSDPRLSQACPRRTGCSPHSSAPLVAFSSPYYVLAQEQRYHEDVSFPK